MMPIETSLHTLRAGTFAAAGVAVVLLLSLLSGTAFASTTLGQNFVPEAYCAEGWTHLQTTSPGIPYKVPRAGVLTSWTIFGPASPSPTSLTAAFKVARESPPGSGNFVLVGGSANHTAPVGSSFTGNLMARVQAGDVIGLYVTSGPSCYQDSTGNAIVSRPGEHLSGAATYPASDDSKLSVSAVLEDDFDGDGRGDESQDADDDDDGAPDATD